MFFKLLISFFGFLFVYRTYQKQIQKGIFSKNFLKKWILVTFLLTFFVFFKFFGSNFAYWISFFSLITILEVTIFVTRLRRESKFREEFINFMDRIVLQMQSGQSFRTSIQIANENSPVFYKPKLDKIIECVLFRENSVRHFKNGFISEILEEFFLIDQFPHRSLQRVLAFRHQLKTEDEIRRKSGQKQRQLRTQSIILSLLYIGTLIFLYFHFDWRKNILIILISLSFFLLGTFFIFRMGQKKIWKL